MTGDDALRQPVAGHREDILATVSRAIAPGARRPVPRSAAGTV
jgi:hypothetical protein